MPVDPEQTAAMARLMNIVGGNPQSSGEVAPVEPNVAAMKDILTKFYSATSNAAVALQEDAQYSHEVRDALITDRIPQGAKVGNWEIRATVINEKLRTYDVYNTQIGESIARELRLYEAAHALVKLFNRGIGINTQQVREILESEETYCKHCIDAVSFRQKMKRMERLNEGAKADIAEDRYVAARDKALQARERLRKLNEGL